MSATQANQQKIKEYLKLGYGNNLHPFGIGSSWSNAIIDEKITIDDFMGNPENQKSEKGYKYSAGELKIHWGIILQYREKLQAIILMVGNGITLFKALEAIEGGTP